MSKSTTVRRRRWNEQGLCTNCGGARDGVAKHCSDCRCKDGERDAALRTKRHEQGICTRCGKRPSANPSKWCTSCQEYQQQYHGPRNSAEQFTRREARAVLRAARDYVHLAEATPGHRLAFLSRERLLVKVREYEAALEAAKLRLKSSLPARVTGQKGSSASEFVTGLSEVGLGRRKADTAARTKAAS